MKPQIKRDPKNKVTFFKALKCVERQRIATRLGMTKVQVKTPGPRPAMDSGESKRRQPTRSLGPKEGRYANFFQVGHNEYEFLIEFGQQDGGIHTRIYVSPQYAHVLSDLLAETLRQHELEFGVKRRTDSRPT